MSSAKFIPFTIPESFVKALYGAEITIETTLCLILTSLLRALPFDQPQICGSYFDGLVPPSEASQHLISVNMRSLLADHTQSRWNIHGILNLVSAYKNLLIDGGDNIFPGDLNGTKTVFMVRPTKTGWEVSTASLDLPVAVTPEYRLILPYNPVAGS